MAKRTNGPPLSPDVQEARLVAETLERELIFGMVKSYGFYRSMRDIVCPHDPKTRLQRQDFLTDRYNILYRAVDAFYRRFDKATLLHDISIPNTTLAAYIIDWGNRSAIPTAHCTQLVEEITLETEYTASLTTESLNALSVSAAFTDWLKSRVVASGTGDILSRRQMGLLTLENLEETLSKMKQAIIPVNNTDFANAANFVRGRRLKLPCVPSGMDALDTAIGGGFYWGDSSMIAAINGGGKTILIMQLAKWFAIQGFRTAVFTTERRPDELFIRTISDHLSIELTRLSNADSVVQPGEEISYIPDWIWQDPRLSAALLDLEETYMSRLLFVDWSRGQNYNVASHFDATIQQMERVGWSPQIILFDWIGGGLESQKDKDFLRLYYQDAADHLINHGKRTGRIMIMAAQLDKAKVKSSTPYVEMSMLSECKTMTNNLTNFIGITSMRDSRTLELKPRLQRRQNLCVDKSTRGQGGSIPVEAVFQFQRFIVQQKSMHGGEPQQ